MGEDSEVVEAVAEGSGVDEGDQEAGLVTDRGGTLTGTAVVIKQE